MHDRENEGDIIRQSLAMQAATTLDAVAKRWRSGGIPGGRREDHALQEYSWRWYTPDEWQAHCRTTTREERRQALRGARK